MRGGKGGKGEGERKGGMGREKGQRVAHEE